MSKQDRQGVRTPADLERKYDFGQIFGDGAGSYAQLAAQFNKLNQSVAQFMAFTLGSLEALERDSATWFNSGVPSLENKPAVEWKTEEQKEQHVGDMYFDEISGRAYLFKKTETEVEEKKETTYEWIAMFGNYLPEDLLVTFYDEDNKVLAVYSVKEGMAVNPPEYDASWQDGDGTAVEFPYTPTENTELYAVKISKE